MRPASPQHPPEHPGAIDPLLDRPTARRAPAPDATAATAEPAHPRWRLPRPLGWALIGVVVVLCALVVADAILGDDEAVAPNVALAGQPVGGLAPAELDAALAALAGRFASTPVTVRSNVGVVTTTAAELGLALDVEATTAATRDANRPGVPLLGWALARAGSADVAAPLTTAGWRGEQVLGTGPVAAEAQLEVRDGALVAVGGVPALGIDPVVVRTELDALEWSGTPIEVSVPAATALPARSAAEVQAVADRANAATAAGVTIEAGAATTVLEPELVRSWVRLAPGPGGFDLDGGAVTDELTERFAERATDPEDARFEIQGGTPVIVGGDVGVRCCDDGAVAPLTAALATGAAPAGPVVVPVVVEQPDVSVEDLDALGVREPVASFTTRFPCCQPRITNIRRMADLLDGQLIEPGATFSVNDEIGVRTADKGFVAAPAIIEGSIGDEIGGGISQVMTTLFNAAFFAGLDFGEYQSHSLYFDRYPYGREATVSWPGPDLEIENTTDHGVVLVTSVGETSITVTMWSTPVYASVEQTGQSEAPYSVSCRQVTTERTRVGLDGEVDVDTVNAIYRREEGLDCDQAELPPTTVPPPPSTTGATSATSATNTAAATTTTTAATPSTEG